MNCVIYIRVNGGIFWGFWGSSCRFLGEYIENEFRYVQKLGFISLRMYIILTVELNFYFNINSIEKRKFYDVSMKIF